VNSEFQHFVNRHEWSREWSGRSANTAARPPCPSGSGRSMTAFMDDVQERQQTTNGRMARKWRFGADV